MLVGLGNPGSKYARNRHNVGFRALDVLASRHDLGEWKTGGKLGGNTISGVIVTPRGRQKVVMLQPMEFMNLSGFAVQRAAKFYGIDLAETLVLHDEIDLDQGVVRVKTGGGHGGHNGLRSIIEQCGAGFARIRIGVGKPGPKPGTADGGNPKGTKAGEKDVAGWVLADFPASQAAFVDALLGRAADAAEAVVGLGVGPAMNEHNGKPAVA